MMALLLYFILFEEIKKQGGVFGIHKDKWHSITSVHERLFVVCARDDGSGTTKLFLEEFQTDMPMDFCDSLLVVVLVFLLVLQVHILQIMQ